MKSNLALALALFAIGQPAIAQSAAPAKCLSVPQGEALVTYLLPKAVDASRAKCSASLPATAPLMIENTKRLAQYRAASENAWPQARKAVSLLAGDTLPAEMDDALLRPIADAMFSQMIGDGIKPKDCILIDKIYADLEPMPARNLASLAITIVQASSKDDGKPGIAICKPPA